MVYWWVFVLFLYCIVSYDTAIRRYLGESTAYGKVTISLAISFPNHISCCSFGRQYDTSNASIVYAWSKYYAFFVYCFLLFIYCYSLEYVAPECVYKFP